MSQTQKLRRVLLTGAVTAMTVSGAWYGASLKSKREHQDDRDQREGGNKTVRIAQLETQRRELVKRKVDLEKKIAKVAERRRENGDLSSTQD